MTVKQFIMLLPRVKISSKYTSFCWSVQSSWYVIIRCLEYLCKYSSDMQCINERDHHYQTALHNAVTANLPGNAKRLLMAKVHHPKICLHKHTTLLGLGLGQINRQNITQSFTGWFRGQWWPRLDSTTLCNQ